MGIAHPDIAQYVSDPFKYPSLRTRTDACPLIMIAENISLDILLFPSAVAMLGMVP